MHPDNSDKPLRSGDYAYVLITPARNEKEYIGKTIESIIRQTVRPAKWVIVSDASNDGTDEIVAGLAKQHSFIQLIRRERESNAPVRDFGAKVKAFHLGYSQLKETRYDFIGNLDADMVCEPSYFESLLTRFLENPALGVAGGIVLEPIHGTYCRQATALNSVCGSVQTFRRECYESFGGYVPIRLGGVDAAAEIMARMKGWEVRTFLDLETHAQRKVMTGGTSHLHTALRRGMANYLLGYHPAFQIASCLSRVIYRPVVISSMATMAGYTWYWMRRCPRSLRPEVVSFLRHEQISRLTDGSFWRAGHVAAKSRKVRPLSTSNEDVISDQLK